MQANKWHRQSSEMRNVVAHCGINQGRVSVAVSTIGTDRPEWLDILMSVEEAQEHIRSMQSAIKRLQGV